LGVKKIINLRRRKKIREGGKNRGRGRAGLGEGARSVP